MRATIRGLFLGMTLLLGGCVGNSGMPLASHVDLSRYAGRWYIIANIPYFAERGKVGSYFDVTFPNDRVRDEYVGYPKTFSAKPFHFVMRGYVVKHTGNAYWRESPIWPLYFDYLILYVDSGYQNALVGYPGKQYGWVLSRSPSMDDATYRALLRRFAALGYKTDNFQRVPQTPSEIGRPGFQR